LQLAPCGKHKLEGCRIDLTRRLEAEERLDSLDRLLGALAEAFRLGRNGFRLFLRFFPPVDLRLIATGCNHGAP
jgi:hypothetical protein